MILPQKEAPKGVLHPVRNLTVYHFDKQSPVPEGNTGASDFPWSVISEENTPENLNGLPYPVTIKTESRFIAEPLQRALDEGFRNLAIKSDMNSGKTYAQALQLIQQDADEISILVVHLASLNRGTAKRIQRETETIAADANKPEWKRTVTNYTNLNPANVLTSDMVTTTFNNLPKVWDMVKASGKRLNILAFDESESGAQFMAHGTISNKAQAAEAMKEASNAAKIRLVMDAHLSRGTGAMTSYFMPDLEFTLLKNTFSVWDGHTYTWIEGRDSGIARIAQLLAQGKKVFVACTSAELAAKLRVALDEQGLLDGLKVLNAFHYRGETDSEELKNAKDNADLFKEYDLVLASPTVGTGVSIEESKEIRQQNLEHFDSVVCFMVRDKDTPDAIAAMQLPFRVRHTRSKHIDLIRVDQADRGKPECDWILRRDAKAYLTAKQQLIESHATDSEKCQILKSIAGMHSAYQVELDGGAVPIFDNYYQIIDDEFSAKKIRLIQSPAVESDQGLADSLKDAGAALQEMADQRKIDAADITEDQAAAIRTAMKFNRQTVTSDDLASLKRFDLVKAYHPEPDSPPTPDQMREYIVMSKEGIAGGRNNIARALLPLEDINKIQKAYHKGIGEEETFKRDIADSKDVRVKVLWKVDRILCAVAGLEFDEQSEQYRQTTKKKEVRAETLRDKGSGISGYSFVRALSFEIDEYNSLKPAKRINRQRLYEKPVEVFRELIDSRLKLDTKKVPKEDAFIILDEQQVLDNANMQRARGSFGDLVVLDRVNAHIAVDETGEFTEEVRARLGIDWTEQRFVKICLEHIPAGKHGKVISEYLRRAALPRAVGDNFTSLARANQYLLSCAGLKEVKL